MHVLRYRLSQLATIVLLSAVIALTNRYAAAQTPGTFRIDDRNFKVSPTASSLTAKRTQLRNFVWGSGGIPLTRQPNSVTTVTSPVGGLTNLQSVRRIFTVMDSGIANVAYYFIPVTRNGRLTIVHMGHGCFIDDGPGTGQTDVGMRRTIAALLANGYAVIGMTMPGFTPEVSCGDHQQIFSTPVTAGSPLKFFLEPVTAALNYLHSQQSAIPYSGYNMVGLSGGGWTATVYPALDTRIRFSLPVAGTVPGWMRIEPYNHDIEQYLASFYSLAGYTDLYLLGASGATGRRQVQILNRQDNCCFGEDAHIAGTIQSSFDASVRYYEWKEKNFLAQIPGSAGFRAIIDEAAPYHMISDYAINTVILPTLAGSTTLNTTIRPLAGDSFCIDVPDFGRPPQNGDQLQVFQCHGNTNQLFSLQATGAIQTLRSNNLCIDVPDFGRPPQNGDRLQLFQCSGGNNQRFDLLSDGTYRSRWGGLCIDIPDFGRPVQNGDPVQLFQCSALASQQFTLPLDATIREQRAGLCVDVPNFGRNPQNGDWVQVFGCNGGTNQKFNRPTDGTIRSQWGGLCLDVADFGRPPRSGDALQLFTCHGATNQQFSVASDGTIHTRWAGLCVNVPAVGRPPQNGDRLQLADCGTRPNQKFSLNL